LNNIGVIYRRKGLFIRALDCYQQCLKIQEEFLGKNGTADVLNNIGVIYEEIGDYNKALEYYLRSFDIQEDLSDLDGMADVLNNIGLIYKHMDNNSKALEYFQESLKISYVIHDKMSTAHVLNNIAEVYLIQGKYPDALDNFQQSLKIKEDLSHTTGMVSSLNNIGLVYYELGNNSKAIEWFEKSLKIAKEFDLLAGQKASSKCLYDAYKTIGNYNKALQYYERVVILDDSLKDEETTKKLQQMEFTRQLQADSLLNEKEKLKIQIAHEKIVRKKNRTKNISLLSGSGIVMVIFFLFVFYRQKTQKDKIIADQKIKQLERDKKLVAARSIVNGQEEERKRIAKELHDGLGVLLSTAKLQFTSLKDKSPEHKPLIDKATKLLEQATGDVRKISHNMMPGLLTKFGLFEAVEDLFEKLNETEKLTARLEVIGETKRLPENKEVMLYRVIQEMINNTLKHAEAQDISHKMNIQSDILKIEYSDDQGI